MKKTITYKPNQRHELGFFKTWLVMARNILNSRELIWQLFKRDFFAAYKKSFLGIAWILLAPILGIVSWVFLNATGVLDPGELDIPYPIYVLVGTTMWKLFMGFYRSAKQTLSAGGELIMQVNYPHEALLFKQTAQHLADFVLSFALIIVVMVAFDTIPNWKTVLLPIVALPVFFLGASIGLLVSVIGVVAVDLDRFISMALGLLLYATPIIYSSDVDNEFLQVLITINPLTYLVGSARDIVLYGHLYDAAGYFVCAALAFVLFMISWRLFYVSEDKIVERMI